MNTFKKGITVEEAWGLVPLDDGVRTMRGVPKTTPEELAEQGKHRGIPMPGPGMAPDREDLPTLKCVAMTKKGNPCKAFATKDDVTCVAHSK